MQISAKCVFCQLEMSKLVALFFIKEGSEIVVFFLLGLKLQSHICCQLPRRTYAWCGEQGCRSVITDGQRERRAQGKDKRGEGVVSKIW